MSQETVAANTTLYTYKALSKAGYKPIGVVGVHNSRNYGTLVVAECFIDANDVVNLRVRNIDDASTTVTFTLAILWKTVHN